MRSQTCTRADEPAAGVGPLLEGAAVYDVEGYRLGFVEATDPRANRFTLVQAGYVLGLLGGTYEVLGEWMRRADSERVELGVPASALRELS